MEGQNGTCPLCNDRGLIILDSDKAAPCRCMRQRRIQAKFRNSRMSREMLNCSLNRFNLKYYSKNKKDSITGRSYYEGAEAARNAARAFVAEVQENPHCDGLVLTGPVGSGKTYLACAIASSLLDCGKEVLFVVVPDLLDQIRATYDQNHEYSEQDLMTAARQVQILILDDLGAHNYTEWARNKLYSIINYRLNNSLPTIITTNLDLAELEEYIGERTTSRVIQICKVFRLMVETDIRIIKRHEK